MGSCWTAWSSEGAESARWQKRRRWSWSASRTTRGCSLCSSGTAASPATEEHEKIHVFKRDSQAAMPCLSFNHFNSLCKYSLNGVLVQYQDTLWPLWGQQHYLELDKTHKRYETLLMRWAHARSRNAVLSRKKNPSDYFHQVNLGMVAVLFKDRALLQSLCTKNGMSLKFTRGKAGVPILLATSCMLRRTFFLLLI